MSNETGFLIINCSRVHSKLKKVDRRQDGTSSAGGRKTTK